MIFLTDGDWAEKVGKKQTQGTQLSIFPKNSEEKRRRKK